MSQLWSEEGDGKGQEFFNNFPRDETIHVNWINSFIFLY